MSVTAVELKAARLERQRARIQKAREQVDAADARVIAAQEALVADGAELIEASVAARGIVLAADASVKARQFAPQVAIAVGAVVVLGVALVVLKRRRAARRGDDEL